MKEELQLELVKKYPKILKDFRGDPMQTCMAWGLECDSGWFNLLDKCFEKIQYFCDLCSKDGREVQVVANQVKEKMSTLRIYETTHGANEIESDIIDNIIDQAEIMSAQTCEVTGEHGVPCVKWGWYKILCYEEARKQGYKACDEGMEQYWQEKDKKKQIMNTKTQETTYQWKHGINISEITHSFSVSDIDPNITSEKSVENDSDDQDN